VAWREPGTSALEMKKLDLLAYFLPVDFTIVLCVLYQFTNQFFALSNAIRTAFLHPSYNPILLLATIELFITSKRFVLKNNSTNLTANGTSRTSKVPSPNSDALNAEYAS
jgi:hypothetical protein